MVLNINFFCHLSLQGNLPVKIRRVRSTAVLKQLFLSYVGRLCQWARTRLGRSRW